MIIVFSVWEFFSFALFIQINATQRRPMSDMTRVMVWLILIRLTFFYSYIFLESTLESLTIPFKLSLSMRSSRINGKKKLFLFGGSSFSPFLHLPNLLILPFSTPHIVHFDIRLFSCFFLFFVRCCYCSTATAVALLYAKFIFGYSNIVKGWLRKTKYIELVSLSKSAFRLCFSVCMLRNKLLNNLYIRFNIIFVE